MSWCGCAIALWFPYCSCWNAPGGERTQYLNGRVIVACYSIGDTCSKGCIRRLSITSKEHLKSPKVGEIPVGRPTGGYICLCPEDFRSTESQAEYASFSVLFAENLVHWI